MVRGPDRQQLGKQGELLARDELQQRGYAILATRYRSRFGEIDIVAERRGVIAFVEVKARRTAARGSAADAVSPRKRRRLAAMALDYLAWAGRLDAPCAFVVIAIDAIGKPGETMSVIEDAWHVNQ